MIVISHGVHCTVLSHCKKPTSVTHTNRQCLWAVLGAAIQLHSGPESVFREAPRRETTVGVTPDG